MCSHFSSVVDLNYTRFLKYSKPPGSSVTKPENSKLKKIKLLKVHEKDCVVNILTNFKNIMLNPVIHQLWANNFKRHEFMDILFVFINSRDNFKCESIYISNFSVFQEPLLFRNLKFFRGILWKFTRTIQK